MDNNLNFILNFQTNAEKVTATIKKLDAATINVSKAAIKVDNAFIGTINSINSKLKTIQLTNVLQQVNMVAEGFSSLAQPGIELGTSLADLSAITGVTGSKLKEIEGYARDSAKTFGGSAAQGVEAYKLVLSQLSPEIAKAPTALKSMGDSINTLSKTMGGDTVAATEVLTTAMNQYQVSTADPIQASKEMATMMNVMAAAAKEGSAELPQIKQALEQSGMAAKVAGVSFAETNAAIQVLDKAGKKGAEGGVALRNVMTTLSEGRFLPKDVKAELEGAGININALGDTSKTLAERLFPLKRIMGDQALVTKLFGKENSAAAIAMISGIEEQKRLTNAITGTNTATEQAGIVMETTAERNKRITASIDDFKISLMNASNGALGYAGVLGKLTQDVTNFVPGVSFLWKSFSFLTSKTKLQAFWTDVLSVKNKIAVLWTGGLAAVTTMAGTAFTFLTSSIFLVPLAIIALIAIISYLIYAFDGWGEAWKHTLNGAKLILQAWVEGVKLYFSILTNGFMIGLNIIKIGWYKFKEAVGMGNSSENQSMIAKINADTEARQKAILDGAKKVKATLGKAKDEFKAAGGSIHANGKGVGTMVTDIKKSLGMGGTDIADPNIPGAKTETTSTNLAGGGVGQKTNEAIATGGTKNTVVNIVIKEMNGVKTNVLQGTKEAIDKTATGLEDAILRTLAMASSAG